MAYSEPLEQAGNPLTWAQEEQLIGFLKEEVDSTRSAVKPPKPDDPAFASHVQQLELQHNRRLNYAQNVLTGPQFQIFKEQQDKKLRLKIHRLKFPPKSTAPILPFNVTVRPPAPTQ